MEALLKFVLANVFGLIGLGVWYLIVSYVVMPIFDLGFVEAALYYTAFSLSSNAVYHSLGHTPHN